VSLPDNELDPPDEPLYTCFYCGNNRLPEEDIVTDYHHGAVIREPIQCKRCAKEMGDA